MKLLIRVLVTAAAVAITAFGALPASRAAAVPVGLVLRGGGHVGDHPQVGAS